MLLTVPPSKEAVAAQAFCTALMLINGGRKVLEVKGNGNPELKRQQQLQRRRRPTANGNRLMSDSRSGAPEGATHFRAKYITI